MIQHLYAYASVKDVPIGETLIDPRFKYVKRGIAKTWGDLGNRWAMNKDYGKHILNIYEQLINYKPEGGITVSKLIALSDGHGVDTAGKRTPTLPNGGKSETGKTYMNENLFNRAVVKYLDEDLRRHGFRTLLVAPTDADTPLETRTNLANSKKADLYVSVHANASAGQWGSHGGIETFTWGSGESLRIGKLIHAELIKGSPLRDRGIKNGSHLWEIRSTNMPCVLVEAGFMDSTYDYLYLLSDAYRKECAEEICRGICKAYGVTYKEVKKDVIKEVLGETIEKVEEDMKLELIDAQWKQLATIFREAVADGVLTDEKWEQKAISKSLTLSEAVYLSLLLDHRRFRDFVKNKEQ